MSLVKIGCCGFPRSRSKYYSEFKLVELQNTFYNLPSMEWVEKIRSEAPEDFEFTVKAWQVITHPSTSPTWRKMRSKPEGELSNYGYLKPSLENIKAFEKVLDVVKALRSRIVVLQTPGNMPFTPESIKWVDEFFGEVLSISPSNVLIGWEPRGSWADERDVLKNVLSKHGILHITDLFKRKPVYNPMGIVYTRLHGRGSGEVNYRYRYSDEDFEKLHALLEEIGFREAYILFNNVYMYDDAKRFKEYLGSRSNYTVV